jgi:predicted DNA-binding transcriptional regulator YafY
MAMRDDDKLVRQLSLLAFLMAQQRPVTADEIHEAVEGYGGMTEQAFLRRFYADRAEIETMGLQLAVERPSDDPFQGDLYALPPENYYLPTIDFSDEELSALQTCLYLLEGQFAYSEPLRLALQHLTLGRPSPLDDHAVRTVSVNLLGSDYSAEVAAHLTKIESAISRRKTVRFTYYSIGRDEVSEREVDPYSLLFVAGNWYMVGFAHEREDVRVFRLSRIRDRITFKTRAEHDFPPPEDFDLAPYRDRAPWQLRGDGHTATIALSSTVAWWVQQLFGAYGRFQPQADGSSHLTTSYGDRAELLNWVLGLGTEAEIIGPDELREAAIDALERVRERHESDAPPPEARDEAADPPEQVPEPTGDGDPAEKLVPAERFARLLALMTHLLASCGEQPTAVIPLDELSESLSMKREVLEDDLALLNLINFGGGCYALFTRIDQGDVHVQKEIYGDAFARPARLSPLEAKALLWALEFVGDRLPVDAERPLSSIREKIEAVIGEENLPSVEIGGELSANAHVAAAVNRAVRDDRVLGIDYWTESRGELRSRTIEPHFLVNSREAWYLIAWCRDANGQRTFRLDRIRAASLHPEHFERRPDVTASGPYLPWGGKAPDDPVAQSASVWCSPRVARWMVEKHRSRESFADGSALVEIPYASEDWLVKELLKYQGEAVLFEPVALRATVSRMAERVLALYGVVHAGAAAAR